MNFVVGIKLKLLDRNSAVSKQSFLLELDVYVKWGGNHLH